MANLKHQSLPHTLGKMIISQVLSACGVWGVGGKDWGSGLQKGVLHTYTLRLGQNIISISYKKNKKKSVYCLKLTS